MSYTLIFDEVMIKQLQKLAKDAVLKQRLIKMLDLLEQQGPAAGKLLDSRLFIYEVKSVHPPAALF